MAGMEDTMENEDGGGKQEEKRNTEGSQNSRVAKEGEECRLTKMNRR